MRGKWALLPESLLSFRPAKSISARRDRYSVAGAHSNGLRNNRDFVSDCVAMAVEIPGDIEELLYDPQTSGGLLLSMPERDACQLMARNSEAYLVGSVIDRTRKPIEVTN